MLQGRLRHTAFAFEILGDSGVPDWHRAVDGVPHDGDDSRREGEGLTTLDCDFGELFVDGLFGYLGAASCHTSGVELEDFGYILDPRQQFNNTAGFLFTLFCPGSQYAGKAHGGQGLSVHLSLFVLFYLFWTMHF